MNAKPNTASLSTMRDQQQAPREASMPAVRVGFFDLQGFELLQRVAKAFATSTLVPVAYQGNVANCMIALNLSERLHADALMVMQNLYIVHGSPGWSSKFLIASVNTCGRYESIRYEWRGEEGKPNFGCRAWTIEKSTGERLNGIWVDWKMVKAEGWDAKKGSKWLTMPDQMFIYRAAAFWQRAYAPEISMGLTTAEELQDTFDAQRGTDGTFSVDVSALKQESDVANGARNVDTSTGEIIDSRNTGVADPDDAALRQLEQQTSNGGFQPTAEEIAEIHAREMAEAGQQQPQQRQRRQRSEGLVIE